ncbi:MAG: DUF4167 domain-containing protein [Alphaproteobacteria bacterium]|nr:DUF4167 domain-containing protein [Alphaproteobacteria bacterium]
MKKNNNKFRGNNNNNNNMYNLNYRFDSVSPAGKFSGTALDLIKRYNELAKEAHASGNYVEMEVFRQYAEHYRKIVTEINERKAANQAQNQQNQQAKVEENQEQQASTSSEQNATAQVQASTEAAPEQAITQQPLSLKKKTLKIVEVKENDNVIKEAETDKPKRTYKRKTKEEPAEAAAV